MEKLSVIVPCKNEEENIRACLETVRWADEIFVVDSGSTDRTVEIAREFTDRVVYHPYVNSAAQKNWAIPQATYPWVMILDCDERVTPELQEEIRTLLAGTPAHDGYSIRRKNWFFGVPIHHCGWDGDDVLRLFRRDLGRYEEKYVHANVVVEGGNVGWLRGVLEHHTYRSFDRYFEKFNRYTTCSALDLRKANKTPSFWNLLVRPLWRFFRMYVLRQGFRDGKAGLILCGLAACQVFVRYAKLWALYRQEAGEPEVEIGRTSW